LALAVCAAGGADRLGLPSSFFVYLFIFIMKRLLPQVHLPPEELETLVHTGGQARIEGLTPDMGTQEEIAAEGLLELAPPQHVLSFIIELEGSDFL
jgi:hypothetical protein